MPSLRAHTCNLLKRSCALVRISSQSVLTCAVDKWRIKVYHHNSTILFLQVNVFTSSVVSALGWDSCACAYQLFEDDVRNVAGVRTNTESRRVTEHDRCLRDVQRVSHDVRGHVREVH